MTDQEFVKQFEDAAFKAGQESRADLEQRINEACARKLGWEKSSAMPSGNVWMRYEEGEFKENRLDGVPDYCHSIEAAWEIVEWVIEMERIDIQLHSDSSSNTKTIWWATFHNETLGYLAGEPWVRANTAPMAICLAFLKLP